MSVQQRRRTHLGPAVPPTGRFMIPKMVPQGRPAPMLALPSRGSKTAAYSPVKSLWPTTVEQSWGYSSSSDATQLRWYVRFTVGVSWWHDIIY